jgi:predicted transposase YbfD/YdcC
MNLSIEQHFCDLTDPRIPSDNQRHHLMDIVVITILATLSGAEGWKDIDLWVKSKADWLPQFLRLPGGRLPSRDTIRRVISRLNPDEFQECFLSWIKAVGEATDGEIIAIDGKTLRRSFDHRSGKAALHMVSAWSATNHLLLGQHAVDGKSNEITAIPKLIKMLELKGAIVTIDAMGCQKEIAKQIVDEGGDYVLALKGNQQSIHDATRTAFEEVLEEPSNFPGRQHRTRETNHGRVEDRTYYQMKVPHDLSCASEWKGLKTIGMVISINEREGKTVHEVRCYLSSLPLGVKRFAEAVRKHWSVENQLHWVLDVTFNEDDSRISKNHGAENMAILRRMAVSIFKQYKGDKKSVRQRRLAAGWDDDYLLNVLADFSAS